MTGEELYNLYRDRCCERFILPDPPWHYLSRERQQVWIELAADVEVKLK